MNEKGKLKVVIAILVAVIALVVVSAVIEGNRQKKELEKFHTYFSSETEKLIYLYRKGCYYCQLLEPAKKSVLDAHNIDYYAVDTDTISSRVLDKILDDLQITQFGTPTLAVVKNNSVVKVQSGAFDLETDNVKEMAQFLTDNKVADLTEFIEEYKNAKESE